MLYMVRKDILPAVEKYMKRLAECMAEKKALNLGLSTVSEEKVLKKLSGLALDILDGAEKLDGISAENGEMTDTVKRSEDTRDRLIPAMEKLRKAVDGAEIVTAKDCWPYPDYGDILYSVK
jgi:glutamine synthetase